MIYKGKTINSASAVQTISSFQCTIVISKLKSFIEPHSLCYGKRQHKNWVEVCRINIFISKLLRYKPDFL